MSAASEVRQDAEPLREIAHTRIRCPECSRWIHPSCPCLDCYEQTRQVAGFMRLPTFGFQRINWPVL